LNGDILTKEYLNDPNTVDFVVRNSEDFKAYSKDKPEVKLVQTLSDRYIVGYTDRQHIEDIIENLGVGYYSQPPLTMGLLGNADLDASGITNILQQQDLSLTGSGVIIGFVDTGIDFTNDIFRNEDGTSRIISIFDQTVSGTPPLGNVIGHEYTNEQINRALKNLNPYEIVPHRDTVGHGTFLASVAAGKNIGAFSGAAPEAELIVVKLKKARPYYLEKYLIPPEQENVYQSSDVMTGVDYIINKAKELKRPVAICIGVGTNLGYHDGYGILEEYLTTVGGFKGVCLCTAAGNECRSGHHTQGEIERTGETKDIKVHVGGNKSKNNNLYISIRNTFTDLMSVTVKSPLGEIVGKVPPRSGAVLSSQLCFSKCKVIIEYHFPLIENSAQETIIKILNANPGVWTITITGDIILDGSYHAYLPLKGLCYPDVHFLEPSPDYTVVVPATCTGSITCAAYDIKSNELYPDSSRGPTLLPAMSPDLAAPGVKIGGYFPEGYGSMSGTSVSAAITAGVCALMLQWGIVEKNNTDMSTYQIRTYLIRGCLRDDGIVYPNTQWGYGKLNLSNTFKLMQQ